MVGCLGPRANRALAVIGHSDERADLELEREGRWWFAGVAILIHVVPVGAVADVAQDSGDLVGVPWKGSQDCSCGNMRGGLNCSPLDVIKM